MLTYLSPSIVELIEAYAFRKGGLHIFRINIPSSVWICFQFLFILCHQENYLVATFYSFCSDFSQQ
jgi:hypothetical protein